MRIEWPEILGGLIGAIVGLGSIAAWFTSLLLDIANNEFWWVVLDIVLSPVGVVRGLLYWFGVL